MRDLLTQVRDLYALSTIEKHRGWYQEHGRMTATVSKAVIARVDELCGQLRPRALELVEGFGTPRNLVDVPITRAG